MPRDKRGRDLRLKCKAKWEGMKVQKLKKAKFTYLVWGVGKRLRPVSSWGIGRAKTGRLDKAFHALAGPVPRKLIHSAIYSYRK